MNTLPNAYITKFSSGLILALLAVSGILFLIPLATPVHAANTHLPVIGFDPYQKFSGGGDNRDTNFNFTNPAGNTLEIIELVISFPAGWSTNGYCDFYGSSPYPLDNCSAQLNSVKFFADASGTGLAPGETQDLELSPVFATASTYPVCGTFTSQVEDAALSYSAGPSFQLCSFDPNTSDTFTTPATSFVAGSAPVSFSLNIGVPDAGVPVVWFASGSNIGTFTGATCQSDGLCWTTTNAAGSTSVSYVPSNLVGAQTVFYYYGSQNAYSDGEWDGYNPCGSISWAWSCDSFTITTVPTTPSQVTIALPTAPAATPNHYATAHATVPGGTATDAMVAGSAISVSLADRFTNPVDYAAGDVLSVTGNNGLWGVNTAAVPTATKATITCADFGVACPSSGTSFPIPNEYFQSGIWGTIGTITSQLTRGTTTYTGISAEVITSTFAVASPVPTATPNGDVAAGGTTSVAATLGVVQQGVPVNMTLDTGTSTQMNGDGTFSGAQWKMVSSSSTGTVSATYTIDTGAGSIQYFATTVSAPTDADPTAVLATSADSAVAVNTVAGNAHGFKIYFYYDNLLTVSATNTVFGSTVWLNVKLVDKFGNPSVNTGANQIQITLTPSAGVLSATNVYIPSGGHDTASSFGPIAWTVPGTAQSLTLTASGVVLGLSASATATLGDVSPLPTIAVLSPMPIAGVIYASSTNPVFSGQANVSIGYPTSITIASVSYKLGSNAWVTTGSAGANTLLWSTAPTLAAGLNTIMFNATDSNASPNVVDTPSYTVLVDTHAPTVAFTTLDGTTIANGGAVGASITVGEGDLNFTSVTATANGTALSPTNIQITGANNLGSSVQYTVAITGLSTGTWVLGLSASSLAGMTGSATQITVHVTVPLNQTFTSTGFTQQTQSGASGVGGSITNTGLAATGTVWFQVLNSNNQVVQGPTFVQTFFLAGQSETFFFALQPGLAHGTYTAQVFVTVAGTAESTTFTVTVTV